MLAKGYFITIKLYFREKRYSSNINYMKMRLSSVNQAHVNPNL
jgi:hypothetical protein